MNLLLVYISGYIWSTPFSTLAPCKFQGPVEFTRRGGQEDTTHFLLPPDCERDPYFGNMKGSEGIPHFVLEGGS